MTDRTRVQELGELYFFYEFTYRYVITASNLGITVTIQFLNYTLHHEKWTNEL